MAQKNVTLQPGESRAVSFEVIPSFAKTYSVSVDGLSGSFVCTTTPVADIRVEDLIISPAQVYVGEPVTISCVVTNIGSEAGTYTVTLGGDFMAQKNVTLQPGESRAVSFEVIPSFAKTYSVSVDGLSGSFVAKAAPVGEVEVSGITMSKTSLIEQDPFTISITFKNPHDYDVWVSPKFAFGKLSDAAFTPEMVLCGWDYVYDQNYQYTDKWDWVDLGLVQHMGSKMTNYIYTPDGRALSSGGTAYLKIPAKGQATTSRLWYISYYARSSPGAWGMFELLPPLDLKPYVKVGNAFNLIYHPEGTGIILYGLPEAIGNMDHYERVNYANVPFAGVAPYTVNVRTTKTGSERVEPPPNPHFENFRITSYTSPVKAGDKCRIEVRFSYEGPALTADGLYGTLWAIIGTWRPWYVWSWGLDKYQSITIPETMYLTEYSAEIDIPITSAVDPAGSPYDIRAGIGQGLHMRITSPIIENCIIVEG